MSVLRVKYSDQGKQMKVNAMKSFNLAGDESGIVFIYFLMNGYGFYFITDRFDLNFWMI